jgi:hypothetical protein
VFSRKFSLCKGFRVYSAESDRRAIRSELKILLDAERGNYEELCGLKTILEDMLEECSEALDDFPPGYSPLIGTENLWDDEW